MPSPVEPYRAKTIAPLSTVPSYEQRRQALERAGYNTYQLCEEEVFLDFAHFRGLHAMSDLQWGGMLQGDEAYAGSRNFYHLEQAVRSIFGKAWVIPVHRGRAAFNLLAQVYLPAGTSIACGPISELERYHFERSGARVLPVPVVWTSHGIAPQIELLSELLQQTMPQYFYWRLSPEPLGYPMSDLDSLLECFRWLTAQGIPILWNASGCFAHISLQGKTVEFLRELASLARLLLWNAREDGFCNTGALLCGNEPQDAQHFQAVVVVFEGLHTYGGLAGRDMEALARGLSEAAHHPELFRHHVQLRQWLQQELLHRGFHSTELSSLWGVHLSPQDFGKGASPAELAALSATLYLLSGIRVGINAERLFLALPLRCYFGEHLRFAIQALEQLRSFAHEIPDFLPVQESPFLWECRWQPRGKFPSISLQPHAVPPYRLQHVELLTLPSRQERERALRKAGYNTFLLRSEEVFIDLLTDSGTSAQSTQQWGALLQTAETLDCSRAWKLFAEAVEEILGFPFVIPTHQGRAAEHILSQTLIRPGQYVLNNMYFTTTREHQERAGGIFVDVIVPDAHDPTSLYPFKGDMDLGAVEEFIHRHGSQQIAYICLEMNVNMAGGQPVSLAATRRLAELAREHGILLVFDATRCAENAYFIREREPGQASRSIAEIVRELMSYADAITFSAKKDVLVNIGGFIALRSEELYRRMLPMLYRFEGERFNGGLAARDLAAMACGLREMVQLEYLCARIAQVQQLGQWLSAEGIPIVQPIGGHAVYIDARRFLPHVPQPQFPAQRLAAEIYLEGGVRTMERGTVSAGRDPQTGEHRYPALELVRLTIPRRVYSTAHLEWVAQTVCAVWKRRDSIRGLRMVYEPPQLRFFTARFEPV